MYERILVPIDGSPTSNRGLQEAIDLARLTHARLRLIHVVDELSFALGVDSYGFYAGELMDMLRKDGAEILEQSLATVRAAGLEADTVLYDNLDKTVQQRVTAETQNWPADLIVLGTHGRRGVQRVVFGSGAESILRTAEVPVLLVRSPGTVKDPAAMAKDAQR